MRPNVPRVMSTPASRDNAAPAPFADDRGVLRGDGRSRRGPSGSSPSAAMRQMWDSEGKEADNQVVRKLLTGYPDFFAEDRKLGRDMVLTLRVPNPRIEHDMRKSMVEALQSVPTAWDMAKSFYKEVEDSPIQEVILPMTTSAEELSTIDSYYRQVIVGQEDEAVFNGHTVKDWVGEFFPKSISRYSADRGHGAPPCLR